MAGPELTGRDVFAAPWRVLTYRHALRLNLRSKLLQSIGSLFFIQVANYAFPLITLPYLWRVLGATSYGEMSFALSFSQYFLLMIDYGFGLSATQAIAQHQDNPIRQSEIFWSVSACKLLLTLGSLVVFSAIIVVLPELGAPPIVLAATMPGFLSSLLQPIWLFQGNERMGSVAWCNFLGRAIALPLIFLLVRSPGDGWVAAFLLSLSAALIGLLSLVVVRRRKLIVWAPPTWRDIRDAFVDGWHVFLSTAAISLYSNSIVVILGLVSGAHAVGIFVASDKIRQAASAAISPITQATYARVNVLMVRDQAEAFLFLRRIAVLLSLLGLLISLGLIVCAPMILRVVLGPSVPEGGVAVLRWLAFAPFVIALSNLFGIQTMLPLGMKREVSRILLVSGLFCVAVMLPLCRAFGAEGAAISVILTETIVTALMAGVLTWKFGGRGPSGCIRKFLSAPPEGG